MENSGSKTAAFAQNFANCTVHYRVILISEFRYTVNNAIMFSTLHLPAVLATDTLQLSVATD